MLSYFWFLTFPDAEFHELPHECRGVILKMEKNKERGSTNKTCSFEMN